MKKTLLSILVVLIIAALAWWLASMGQNNSAEHHQGSEKQQTQGTGEKEQEMNNQNEVDVPDDWQTYESQDLDFALSYPREWQFGTGGPKGERADVFWSELSETEGKNLLTMYNPTGFMEGTNFAGARVTLGMSDAPEAMENCTAIPENHAPQTQKETVAINGVDFTKISTVGAATGDRYETASYRVVHDGSCFALETRLHYSAIEFYGEDSDVEEFDKAAVENTLKRIVKTFAFSSE